MSGYQRHYFKTRRDAFLSGLGIGLTVGASGMLGLVLWLMSRGV